jgi:hypothetical protein
VGDGSHGIQTRCNGAKNLEWGRVKCTGTPMLGLPPVPSGDVAFFLVRGVLRIGAHYVARDPIMGIVKPMKPAVEGAGPGRREQGDVRVRVRG